MKFFEWKGEPLETVTKVIDKALKLEGEEQKAFVKAWCDSGVYARQNVGYFAGYYSRETALRIWEIFETAHPIFGTTRPTTDEAFKAGQELMRLAAERRKP